jgi:hypothetical protein
LNIVETQVPTTRRKIDLCYCQQKAHREINERRTRKGMEREEKGRKDGFMTGTVK